MNQILGSVRGRGRHYAKAEQGFDELDCLVADLAAEVCAWRSWKLLLSAIFGRQDVMVPDLWDQDYRDQVKSPLARNTRLAAWTVGQQVMP
jgi:hypothetical protein